MANRPKRKSRKSGEDAVPAIDDALALLVQMVPDKLEDFVKLSNILSQVLSRGWLNEDAVGLISAARNQVDRLIRGESSDAEEVLVETSRLLEAASAAMEMEGIQEASFQVTADLLEDEDRVRESIATALELDCLSPDIDADLLAEFVLESSEMLDRAESALLALENNPDDVEAVNTVFRAFHTIKGTAGFMGLRLISELAHLAESLLSRVRSREIQLTGGCADLALRSIDMLKKAAGSLQCVAKGARFDVPAGFEELKSILSQTEGVGVPMPASPGKGQVAKNGWLEEADAQILVPQALQGISKNTEYDSSIRVNTARLDRLIDLVGELVIAQSMVAQDPQLLGDNCPELQRKVTHAGKIVRELQDLSMSMRMVPLRGTFQRMQRVVRDLVRKSGKAVELEIDDGGTEIDRHMVAILSEVLVHMVRNAIDHGIEAPDDRERSGKPRVGTVRLTASYSGGTVIVEIMDDGRGLNREKILQQAVSAGIVKAGMPLSDNEVFRLIFAPGLSTSEQITDLSGRGVGMDVVQKGVESLHGRIEINSASGVGSTFTVRLPMTLAITDGMLVRVGSERYIIPTISIQLCFRPEPDCISTVTGRGELVMLRGDVMPLFRLHRLFGIRSAIEDPVQGLLVIVGDENARCAILVDELLGQQQVVAKSLSRAVGKILGISGGAILGDGQVGLILDTVELAARAQGSAAQLVSRAVHSARISADLQ